MLQSRGMHSAILPAEWEPAPCLCSRFLLFGTIRERISAKRPRARGPLVVRTIARHLCSAAPRLYLTLRHSVEVPDEAGQAA